MDLDDSTPSKTPLLSDVGKEPVAPPSSLSSSKRTSSSSSTSSLVGKTSDRFKSKFASLKEDSRDLFKRAFDGVDTTISRNEDLEKEKKRRRIIPRPHQIKEFWVSYGLSAMVITLWVIVNVLLFSYAADQYWDKPNYYVTVARGFGMLLNFNCALILVPVLRNLLTLLRKTPVLNKFIPWDANIFFHRGIAWWIAFCAIGHGCAHYLNYNEVGNPWALGWTTKAGLTGHLLALVILLMYSSAQNNIKRNHFNHFFSVHHLFIAFFILVLLHGPRFWKFLLGPGILYAIERIVREWRGHQGVTVVRVQKHPSDVLEVVMSKPSFKYKAGQYLYLSCPYISRYEWHPFTITSAPSEDHVSVHIRCVGPWTRGLDALIGPETEGTLELNKETGPNGQPIIKVDGPFGSASEEVFGFEVAVLVGAGIGVTPFASILKYISYLLHQEKQGGSPFKLRKVYFFWICRDYTAFEWFKDLLADLEVQVEEEHSFHLEVNIYLTAVLKANEIKSVMERTTGEELDPLTSLRSKTHYGRPNWDAIFPALRTTHTGKKIGVFFCGPPPLAKKLKESCVKYSKNSEEHQVQFRFFKENF